MIPTVTIIRKLIGLLHLASPALPIGAYSYSQGLEGAVDAGLIHDALSARAWIQSGEHVLATNELPMLAILYRDWADAGNVIAAECRKFESVFDTASNFVRAIDFIQGP